MIIRHCSVRVPFNPSWSMDTPQGNMAGLVVAYIRAAATIFSAGTPVISATLSGGYS